MTKSFSFGKDMKLALFADALNLFNSGVNKRVEPVRDVEEDFAVASDFVFPRRLMLGAKFTF